MEEIKLYNFEKAEKFSIENIKYLLTMSEEFCKISNMQIAYETRNENLILDTSKSNQSNYGEFIEGVNKDCAVIEYNINPLVENLTLFIEKRVVLSLVDLLLGGNGSIDRLDRELTTIDLELFKYLMGSLLNRLYVPYEYTNIEIIRIYTNIVQYQKLKNKDMVFESAINVDLESFNIGKIIFCIPYKSVESVINDLVTNKFRTINKLDSGSNNDIVNKEIFEFTKSVQVDICAKLGSARVSVSELLNLEEGDVILLNEKVGDNITVSVGDAGVYKAKPGLIGIKKGIQITEIINEEK